MTNKNRLIYLFLIVVVLLTPTVTVNAINKNTGEDTQVGKANEDIEKAIAKGKELIGKTDYWFGRGHGGVDTEDYKGSPPKLDCSSFVHWMYYKGAGKDIDKGQVLSTFGYQNYYGKHYKKIDSEKDLNRGDLVQLNNNAHVEVYLGDGKYISQTGNGGSPDKSGGVHITNGNWERSVFDGYKVDMASVLEDKKLVSEGKAEALKDGDVKGSEEGDSEKGKNSSLFTPFNDKSSRTNPLGLESKQSGESNDSITIFNIKSQKVFEKGIIVVYYISGFLIAYILLIAVSYFIAPFGFDFIDKQYKFLTGRELIQDSTERKDIIITTIISLTIIGLVMSYKHLDLMAMEYKIIEKIFEAVMGVGGMIS